MNWGKSKSVTYNYCWHLTDTIGTNLQVHAIEETMTMDLKRVRKWPNGPIWKWNIGEFFVGACWSSGKGKKKEKEKKEKVKNHFSGLLKLRGKVDGVKSQFCLLNFMASFWD